MNAINKNKIRNIPAICLKDRSNDPSYERFEDEEDGEDSEEVEGEEEEVSGEEEQVVGELLVVGP